MTRAFHRLRHYLRLFAAFMRASLLSQLEYRLNFISGVFVESAYMCIKLTYLVVVIRAGVNIGALTPDMVMIFVGSYCFLTGVWMLLSGVNSIPRKILNGGLDMLMVKPGSLMFMQTLGSFDFAMTVPNCSAGVILICAGWSRAHIPVTPQTAGGFVFFMLTGAVLTYAFTLIPALLTFWVTSTGGTMTLFAALWDFNNMPMALYGKTIQRIGTFVIPVFLLTNWAGLFALKRLTAFEIAWGAAAPVIVMCIARFMWKRGLRRYTSANG